MQCRVVHKGQKKRRVQVPALHILDQEGTVVVIRLQPARPPGMTEVYGRTAYVPALPQCSGDSALPYKKVSCSEVISVVTLDYDPEHDVYTLADSDQKGLQDWLSEHLQREASESSNPARGRPHHSSALDAQPGLIARPKAGPSSRGIKRAEKDVRRSAWLSRQV